MKVGIYWFRKALRLHDNVTLSQACNECDILYPLFILDPTFTTKRSNNTNGLRAHATGGNLPNKNCFTFFFETLADLNQSLSSKYKSALIVIRGTPNTALFTTILKSLKVTDLYFETDTEPYAKHRDNEIVDLCSKSKINVHSDYGHTLYPPQFLIDIVQNEMKRELIPTTYRGFLNVLQRAKDPQKPLDAPSKIPGNDAVHKLLNDKELIKTISDICNMNQYAFKIPTLSELPYDECKTDKINDYEIDDENVHKYMAFIGGETNALKTMEKCVKNKQWICRFEKPKTSPNGLEASTTTLSMYITNGSLSCRLLWHEIDKIYKKSKNNYTKPPSSLHGQLYFREWFYLLSHVTPNFHQMEGNKLCKQILWDEYDEEKVEKWRLGQTGYPFIDALMIQLRRIGWIHHLGRHAVACFLTRGDLWQNWEIGRDIFADYLLDGDYALNAANWMWLSASAFFTAYFRVYSPISFGKKTDKSGEFIKHWIPKLRMYNDKYIYEPWNAPKELQRQWGCVIGEDYPLPMVDHDVARKRNLTKIKLAFDAHKRNKNKGKVAGKKRKRNEMS